MSSLISDRLGEARVGGRVYVAPRTAEELVQTLTKRRRELHRQDSRRWNQRALAARLGWGQSRISDYEAGKQVPSLPALLALATELGVTITLGFDDGGRS